MYQNILQRRGTKVLNDDMAYWSEILEYDWLWYILEIHFGGEIMKRKKNTEWARFSSFGVFFSLERHYDFLNSFAYCKINWSSRWLILGYTKMYMQFICVFSDKARANCRECGCIELCYWRCKYDENLDIIKHCFSILQGCICTR